MVTRVERRLELYTHINISHQEDVQILRYSDGEKCALPCRCSEPMLVVLDASPTCHRRIDARVSVNTGPMTRGARHILSKTPRWSPGRNIANVCRRRRSHGRAARGHAAHGDGAPVPDRHGGGRRDGVPGGQHLAGPRQPPALRSLLGVRPGQRRRATAQRCAALPGLLVPVGTCYANASILSAWSLYKMLHHCRHTAASLRL